jgi:Uma2 family endonuclease
MLELAGATIDDTVKPAIEWIGGKPVQKLMPTAFHAFVQSAFLRLLYEWAKVATGGRGRVGTEWRFRVPANAYDTLSVVPDVAFVADLTEQPQSERQYPAVPPDIVVEVRSPGDDATELVKKRDFYLWWGVKLVITADPAGRTIEAKERNQPASYLDESQTLTSSAFPSLVIPVRAVFAELDGLD